MATGRIRDHSAAGGAHEQPLLQQERFHHGLQGDGVVAKGRRQSLEAHRAATVVVDQQLQRTPITGIEAPMINAVQAQGLSNNCLLYTSPSPRD